MLVAFVLVVLPTLGQPLLERHGFRQTQTAYTARIYHEQGIDLIHPKLPVLGEPFEVPFEFPLFQAAASVVMDAGVRDDVAMRTTGLLCFLLTALLLYGLVRRVDGRVSAVAALVAFVATPFALLWGRTSMIEYLATAGAVGFAWATIAWREERRPAVGGLALAAGLVGMLVKPTTAVFWILPALAYQPTSGRQGDSEARAHVARRTRARPTRCGRAVDASRRRDQGGEPDHGLAHERRAERVELRNARTAFRQRHVGGRSSTVSEGSSSATRGSRFSSSQRSRSQDLASAGSG